MFFILHWFEQSVWQLCVVYKIWFLARNGMKEILNDFVCCLLLMLIWKHIYFSIQPGGMYKLPLQCSVAISIHQITKAKKNKEYFISSITGKKWLSGWRLWDHPALGSEMLFMCVWMYLPSYNNCHLKLFQIHLPSVCMSMIMWINILFK